MVESLQINTDLAMLSTFFEALAEKSSIYDKYHENNFIKWMIII